MMRSFPLTVPVAMAAILLVPACQRTTGRKADAPDSVAVARADSITVRTLVLDFGARMKRVSLLAPDSARERSLRSEYGNMVTGSLLTQWAKNPTHAPGRMTSSPWPDRIEIGIVSRKSPKVFLVDGDIVERTSADPAGESGRIPIRLAIRKSGTLGWRITGYDQGPPRSSAAPALAQDDPNLTPERAAAVIRAFFDALKAKQFREAYLMWEAEGAASGQGMIEFVNTWAQLQSVEAEVGAPGRMGAAAGSRYVDVPVRVTMVKSRGEREIVSGTYTVRCSVVDGATSKQRTWHIYSATLHKERAA